MILYEGQSHCLKWATDVRGRQPAKEFFDKLEHREKAKMLALFHRLGDQGEIQNRENFKKVQDGLFEFKRHQLRFLGDFRPSRTFVVACGLRKKRNRLAKTAISRALRVLQEHDAAQSAVGREGIRR